MSLFRNSAFWVLMSAVGLYWLSVVAVGSDATRYAVDIAIVFMGLLLPYAVEKFFAGGSLREWRLLIGQVLWWAGIASWRFWALATRYEGRPDWMIDSPMNGFFAYWIAAAGVLSISVYSEAPAKIPSTRVYYVAVGLMCGLFIGILIGRSIVVTPYDGL